MDCTSTRHIIMAIFEGRQWWGRDNQKEIKDWSSDRTNIYFPLLSSMQQHCMVVQFVHGCPKGTSTQWPSSSPESRWMIDITTLESWVENSNFNTITFKLQNPPLKGIERTKSCISYYMSGRRKFNLLIQWHNNNLVWQEWCYPSHQIITIDSTIVDTTLLSVLLQAV